MSAAVLWSVRGWAQLSHKACVPTKSTDQDLPVPLLAVQPAIPWRGTRGRKKVNATGPTTQTARIVDVIGEAYRLASTPPKAIRPAHIHMIRTARRWECPISRSRWCRCSLSGANGERPARVRRTTASTRSANGTMRICLLYTSDAADDLLC